MKAKTVPLFDIIPRRARLPIAILDEIAWRSRLDKSEGINHLSIQTTTLFRAIAAAMRLRYEELDVIAKAYDVSLAHHHGIEDLETLPSTVG